MNPMQKLILTLVTLLGVLFQTQLFGSDHDDGEMDLKGRSLNLTDLYAFREDWQDANGSKDHLILIMNSNPRSLGRQQYFFSSQGRYEFHLKAIKASEKATRPTGDEDVILSFRFSAPDATDHQKIFMRVKRGDKVSEGILVGTTTTLTDMNRKKIISNEVPFEGESIRVFAGLREDPFYFDVERYFGIRGLLATGVNKLGPCPIQGGPNVFCSDATSNDFAAGYNVNSLALRVPISLLQSDAKEPVFDVWETISVPIDEGVCSYLPNFLCRYVPEAFERWIPRRHHYQQIERLGRPAINEGLVISNDLLNKFNAISPKMDLTPEASPIIHQAASVLTAVHNYGVANGLPAPEVGDVATGFLPDVLRIDTSNSFAVDQWAYNGDFVIVNGSQKGAMLTGGRKIEDDVMDITLSYLIAGNPLCGPNHPCAVSDGVSYSGGTDCAHAGSGSNPSAPGHHCLYGQTQREGSAYFPFLAEPN